ncbi:Probable ribosome-binding factor A-chloroplastic [Striga hermonthica]|uniref:Probable ribosome-binding factor A-chloroplastic n=1 Tax=Striga hermonthica TaxID=68872 RepID=A0A9N7R2E2_STRHE|nr:Probable ribosome-binding factor A-chloroplastic [Striga hermonthica]
MPHTLNHCSTIALSWFTAHSARPFCSIASIGFCLRQPHRVVTSTTFGGGITNGPNGTNRSVICMANPRRVQMVSRQIRREISDMLLMDKVLQHAVLPESALGADRYLSSVTTVTDVEVSADLQVVKVYVSVFGDERGKEVAIAGLKSKAKYVRSQLGKRMKLRLTPEVRFIEDESIERGSRVLAILDRLKEEREREATKVGDHESDGGYDDDDDDDDEEWKDDDMDDEGIIYVD